MRSTHSELRDDHDAVYRLIMAGWGSQVVRALAAFSIAERLESGPLTADQIAEELSSNPEMTFRVMRAGAALGLLYFDRETMQFSATPLLEILHGSCPLSLKQYAQVTPGTVHWLPGLMLPETVLRGRNYAREVLGSTPFEYYAHNASEARQFSASMTELSTPVIEEAVSVIDVGDARLAVDIGGADGAFVAALLLRHPELTGLVHDLPQVVSGVVDEARRRGLADRMKGISGDFFTEVPSADIYLLKFVLHDWDDDSCELLLSNIRRAMRPAARLIIVEMAADETALEAALMDVAMLCAYTGQERNESQYDSLLTKAGLRTARVRRLHQPYFLLEAIAI